MGKQFLSLGLLTSLLLNVGIEHPSSLGMPEIEVKSAAAQTHTDTVKYHPPTLAYQSMPQGQRQANMSQDCPASAKLDHQKRLTALIPDNRRGWTIRPRPTFWVYLPPGLGKSITFEFILKEIYLDTDYTIHTKIKSISDTSPGFIQIPMPDDIPPLRSGRQYQWTFAATCNGITQLFVDGFITRHELSADFEAQIEQLTPQEQVRLFAQKGYWYEALNLLAEYRLEYPTDTLVQQDWTHLLQSVQLDGLAASPMKGCCFP